MLYTLSKIIPVPMRSKYSHLGMKYKSRWVQWRGHVFFHNKVRV